VLVNYLHEKGTLSGDDIDDMLFATRSFAHEGDCLPRTRLSQGDDAVMAICTDTGACAISTLGFRFC
jgi:hypothetical protein